MKPSLAFLAFTFLGSASLAVAQEVTSGQLFGDSFLEIRSPNSAGWQRVGKAPGTIAFARRGEASNESFVAQASVFALPPTKNSDEFVSLIRSATDKDSPPDRFTTIEATFEYSEDRGYPCVRYTGVSEDKQAKTGLFSREPLKLQVVSLYCRHPQQATVGFVAAYTHRGQVLYSTLDSEAEVFIQGVRVPPK